MGGQLRGTSSNSSESDLLSWTDPNKITWINGVIELIGIIEKGAYSPSLLSWKGQSNKVISNPSNGYMYYNTEKTEIMSIGSVNGMKSQHTKTTR